MTSTVLGYVFGCQTVPAQPRSLRKTWVLWFACLALLYTGSSAQEAKSGSQLIPHPSAVIDLSESDYRPQSRGERLEEDVNGSLTFIDDNHLLVTFDPKQLFSRLPDCPKEHADRLMRAMVVEVPSGKVVKETTWYLHDSRRYVWPLGSGQLLLRRLNTLYLIDSNLQETKLLEAPEKLLWVDVTPDQSQIIVEAREEPEQNSSRGTSAKSASKEPKFVLGFLDKKTLRPQRTLTLDKMVKLDGTSTGYVDMLNKGDVWLIRYGPSADERRNIARVKASAEPRVFYSSDNSLVIGRCCSSDGAYSVGSFALSGRRLWKQHWNQPRYYPVVTRSSEGDRFAVSTLNRKKEKVIPGDLGEDDPNYGLEQNVQVFETATGTPVLSVLVDPVIASQQNFAMSSDGRRLAVLVNSVIQVYELPPSSPDEAEKFAALKTDVYLPPSESSDEAMSAAAKPGDQTQGEAGAPAAEPQPTASTTADDSPVATFRAETRAVVVDVVVTDGKGRPIKGLQQQDFEVTEDGRAQGIRYFREVGAPQSAQAEQPPTQTTPKQDANVYTNTSKSEEPGPLIMVLLDLLNTPAADQQYAREQLLSFIKTKASKGAHFALCTLTGDKASPLRLIEGFTTDENVLLSALNDKKKKVTKQARWQTAAQSAQGAVNTVGELARGDTQGWGNLLGGLEVSQSIQREVDTDARVSATTSALMQLANYLAGISGRKSLVWLSGSFPITLSVGMNSQTPSASNRNYTRMVEQASNLLAQSQVAVYPVDVRGLTIGSLPGVTDAGSNTVRRGVPAAPSAFASQDDASSYQQQPMDEIGTSLSERATISRIAAATGGKAFYNSNSIDDAIATATEQGSSYYTISYNPDNKNYDGRFRKIKVALAQKGYHLFYRPGYFATNTNSSAKDLGRNMRVVAMRHGSPPARQIQLSVWAAPVGPEKKILLEKAEGLIPPAKDQSLPPDMKVKVQHHSIDYVVNSSDLRFVPLENGSYRIGLMFMVNSFDSNGRPLSRAASTATSDLTPEAYKEVSTRGFRAHQEVDVPATATSLRIGVQDQLSTYIGTVDVPLPLPQVQEVPRVLKSQLPEVEPN